MPPSSGYAWPPRLAWGVVFAMIFCSVSGGEPRFSGPEARTAGTFVARACRLTVGPGRECSRRSGRKDRSAAGGPGGPLSRPVSTKPPRIPTRFCPPPNTTHTYSARPERRRLRREGRRHRHGHEWVEAVDRRQHRPGRLDSRGRSRLQREADVCALRERPRGEREGAVPGSANREISGPPAPRLVTGPAHKVDCSVPTKKVPAFPETRLLHALARAHARACLPRLPAPPRALPFASPLPAAPQRAQALLPPTLPAPLPPPNPTPNCRLPGPTPRARRRSRSRLPLRLKTPAAGAARTPACGCPGSSRGPPREHRPLGRRARLLLMLPR
jgi:hypothetical protein